MDIISLYKDVFDRTAAEQNGSITIDKFNRYEKLAELRLLDYLSGDIEGVKPPEPYATAKLRAWLSKFIAKKPVLVVNGAFQKPADFYRDDRAAIIGSYLDEVCGKIVTITGANTPIEILDGPQFDYRCNTYIKSLRPSARKPIGTLVGDTVETMPRDLGSIMFYYIRYPVYGEVKVKIDPIYNDEVPDPATSKDNEWPEFAREFLIYFMTEMYTAGTRERAGAEVNQVVNKSERGSA